MPLPVYSGPFGPRQAERLLWRAGFGPRRGEEAALARRGLDGAVAALTNPGAENLAGKPPKVDGRNLHPTDTYGSVLTGVGVAVLAAIFGRPLALVVLVGFVGLVAPTLWFRMKAHRRMNAFDEQLADVLLTMSASLKVGQSFTHSLGAIVNDGLAPASEEFERVLYESQLGRPIDDALAAMADRIDSEDMRFVLLSVAIQREIGGSLADLFQTISDTVRDRQNFRRKVRALTAMGRMSAYLLLALPFLVAVGLSAASPGYMSPLYHTSVGHVFIVVTLVMMCLGAVALKKIVSVKG